MTLKKNDYCNLNNIPLYRIKYSDNIKEAISQIRKLLNI